MSANSILNLTPFGKDISVHQVSLRKKPSHDLFDESNISENSHETYLGVASPLLAVVENNSPLAFVS